MGVRNRNYLHNSTIELRLQHRADLNAKGMRGNTALTDAVFQGRDSTVRLLMQYQPDVNALENVCESCNQCQY